MQEQTKTRSESIISSLVNKLALTELQLASREAEIEELTAQIKQLSSKSDVSKKFQV